MTAVVTEAEAREPFLTIHLSPAVELSDEQFFELCQINSDLRLERNAKGDIIVMPPTGGETSNRNQEVTRQLGNWAKRDDTGAASAGFKLPNGAERSPDAAWISRERLEQLTPEQKRKYIENGARLGWLIHADAKRVYVYRPEAPMEDLKGVTRVSGDPELPGFTLDLEDIWKPNI
jgi:Uma2 family endonuclease